MFCNRESVSVSCHINKLTISRSRDSIALRSWASALVGASFAAAFRSAHPDARVLAVDVDQRTLAQALERGWATEGALPADPAFRRFVDEGCDLRFWLRR